jgi:hypothetical protein
LSFKKNLWGSNDRFGTNLLSGQRDLHAAR